MRSLYLVRHGRTDHNAAGRLLGRLDPSLDELGRTQADAVAAAVVAEAPRIGRVISSPLARTRETAARIADAAGVEVEIDDRWIELDYGEFDGLLMSALPPDVWATWRADVTFTPPGGESLVQLRARVDAALDELRREALVSTDAIVVVSHVSPIKAAVAWTLGVGDEVSWRMYLAPASICRVRLDRIGPSLLGYNDVSHLGERN
jgi:broad specificity phosphatase PhoE